MSASAQETSDVDIVDNEILYLRDRPGIWMSLVSSRDTTNRIHGSLIAYNGVGIQFLNDWTGNVLEDNLTGGNDIGGGASRQDRRGRNEMEGNHWDDYAGSIAIATAASGTPRAVRLCRPHLDGRAAGALSRDRRCSRCWISSSAWRRSHRPTCCCETLTGTIDDAEFSLVEA